MKNEKLYGLKFATVYPLYVQKVERKGHTKEEVDTAIGWLTGYDPNGIVNQIDMDVNLEEFILNAPQINPKYVDVKGVICGVRVEDLQDPVEKQIRILDKLVDDIAKGKKKLPWS